ncbi:MAG: response regulator [Eubacteriales bacterium]|nr:response regulator [Eubacteriales bacterium]
MFRVLIADDEPIERLVVTKKIQKYFQGRLEVVQAENGKDAVRLFQEQKCSIALLDISMPGMDGLEAAEKIREMDNECSIIFLTAFDEFNYAKRAFSVRALDYLLKPGSDEELTAVLEEALRLAEKTEKLAEIQETASLQEDISEERGSDNVRMQAVSDAIRTYIEENYAKDISLQTVSEAMGYADAYFCKIFKHCFDKNFTAYLAEFRVEEAKKLLLDVSVNIKDICTQVGFHDSNYFARVFKRTVGETPSEYRNHILGKSGKV